MTTTQMREALLKAYPGKRWAEKVKKMDDGQIFVVYTRVRNSGRI